MGTAVGRGVHQQARDSAGLDPSSGKRNGRPSVELSVGRIGTAQVFNVDDRRSRGPNGRGRTGSVLFETDAN